MTIIFKNSICFSLVLLLQVISADLFAQSERDQKLILIHVDGLSLPHFLDEKERGNLPNLTAYFGVEGIIKNTVTYFPSKTPTVISSVKDGVTPDNAALAGWIQTDENGNNVRGMVSTFLQMAFSKPRMATTNLIYGIPILDNLAGPAMQNIPTYLRDYDVIQFFWYKTDTHAHFYGEERYLKQLQVFDREFGKLIRRLPDDVNVVIYSDHGLTFGEGIDLGNEVEAIVGDDLLAYSFPTLYLNDPDRAATHAKNLVDHTAIAVTFYRGG
ncbi:alkaline phosphatase family protein [Rhodohalobacter halophilus]|uniref:alkaline phosphatase family protein n=1 Tax=Rhodohalobacter halophilus TaxID=1812810 RepID=UPI000A03F446|nr:alkaline phosphatase family protein [Rhodohalobacter halophilus]